MADAALTRALEWTDTTRLHIQAYTGLIVVAADEHGIFRLSRLGHVKLPAAARHWCRLGAGGRVLLTADPVNSLLIVHPPVVLQELVTGLHATRFQDGAA
ncbi:AbrB/MazE/SpoVT family DNA-binding domain-containing protein [Dactylosporangium sp. McL0621]|uniref:AbrB/MazE/SpoVT family DNA-binding domain-containing protein n=1 Tax=Dactylosporangium sp. McL0621 TaxID=3415678 RepID=UPI003CF01480